MVHRNCHDFLDLIAYKLKNKIDLEDTVKLVKKREIIENLWNAIISREIQFRCHFKLKENRKALINAGAKEPWMKMPDWLKTQPES